MRIAALPLILLVPFLVVAVPAGAADVSVTFTGTVFTVTGDLNGPIATSDTISGTLTYDDTTAGVFTPSPNPMFVRSQMLYTGAVTAVSVTVNGDTVSGSSGDTLIFDATDMFAGEDSYEVTSVLDTGTIGGVTPASFFWNPSFAYTAYTLTSGDPLPQPLPQAQSTFLQFQITSAGGGTAYGAIDSYTVSGGGGPPAVPALPVWGLAALTVGLACGGRRLRRAAS